VRGVGERIPSFLAPSGREPPRGKPRNIKTGASGS
jgi:hypothetical protein